MNNQPLRAHLGGLFTLWSDSRLERRRQISESLTCCVLCVRARMKRIVKVLQVVFSEYVFSFGLWLVMVVRLCWPFDRYKYIVELLAWIIRIIVDFVYGNLIEWWSERKTLKSGITYVFVVILRNWIIIGLTRISVGNVLQWKLKVVDVTLIEFIYRIYKNFQYKINL